MRLVKIGNRIALSEPRLGWPPSIFNWIDEVHNGIEPGKFREYVKAVEEFMESQEGTFEGKKKVVEIRGLISTVDWEGGCPVLT